MPGKQELFVFLLLLFFFSAKSVQNKLAITIQIQTVNDKTMKTSSRFQSNQ